MYKRLIPLMALPIAVACVASEPLPGGAATLGFSLTEQSGQRVAASFQRAGERHHDWTTSFAAAELNGLDLARLNAGGSHPVRFALNRQSGHLDCSGTAGNGRATGQCGFAPQPAFAAALAQAKVAAPDSEEWLELFALDVRRELLDSLRASGFPPPSVDELVEMTAVGVDGAYIRALAAAGYKPNSLDSLVEMRAVGVTPEWIGGFARIGLGNLPMSQLVELRALGVDSAYVQSFRALGYGVIDADDLVAMKALGVTADFARDVERNMGRQSPEKLVELKALGFAWRR